MARKGLYDTKVKPRLKEIAEWYSFQTEEEIAKRLGVGKSSWYTYKNDHPELREALTKGREDLITELKATLKRKAQGFHFKETKRTIRSLANGEAVTVIEEYERYSPPDLGAIHLLLKNLDPEWRNDDQTTVDMKRERMALEKEKTEEKIW